MRENIKKEIKNSLGNGKVKILCGAYSKTMKEFLVDEIRQTFKNTYYIGSVFTKVDLLKHLSENLSAEDSAKKIFIIDRLPDYNDIDGIINLFAGNSNVDLIASSNIHLEDLLGNRSTVIRGRVQYIAFPPFLYSDFLDNHHTFDLLNYVEDTDETLFDYIPTYKYRNEVEKICDYIAKNVGYPINFRGMFENMSLDVSLNTFVSVFNYAAHHRFFYALNKFDLKKMDTLPNYLYCYPTDISQICRSVTNIDKQRRSIYETAIIAKLINDNNLVYKAVYRNSENKHFNALANTYFVVSKNKQYLLKLYFTENQDSLERYYRYKSLYPRYIIIMDDIDTYVDEHGVTYMSVKNFLTYGVQ